MKIVNVQRLKEVSGNEGGSAEGPDEDECKPKMILKTIVPLVE